MHRDLAVWTCDFRRLNDGIIRTISPRRKPQSRQLQPGDGNLRRQSRRGVRLGRQDLSGRSPRPSGLDVLRGEALRRAYTHHRVGRSAAGLSIFPRSSALNAEGGRLWPRAHTAGPHFGPRGRSSASNAARIGAIGRTSSGGGKPDPALRRARPDLQHQGCSRWDGPLSFHVRGRE